MFAYKILLLLLACIPFAHLRLTRRPWSRRSQNHADNDCLCYSSDSNSYTLGKALDPNNYGIKRLVIYVYQVQGENNVKVFIPNAEEQTKLPDLPYNSNDFSNTEVTECLEDIFQSSSEKIPLGTFEQNLDTQNYDTITLQPGLVHTSYNYNHNGESDSDTSSKQSDDLDQQDIIYPNRDFIQDQDSSKELPSLDSYSDDKKLSSHASAINPESKPESFSQWFDQQLKRFEKVVPSDYDIVIHGATFKELVQNVIKTYGFQFAFDGRIVDQNGRPIDLSKFELRPIFVGSKIEHKHIFQHPHETVTIPKSHYLEGILVMYTDPAQILGMVPLRKTHFGSATKVNGKKHNRQQYWQANNGVRPKAPLPSIERLTFGTTNPHFPQPEAANTNPKTKTSSSLFQGHIKLSPKKIAISHVTTKHDHGVNSNAGFLNTVLNSASQISKSLPAFRMNPNVNLKDLASNLPNQRKIMEYLQLSLNRRNSNEMPKEDQKATDTKLPYFSLKNLVSILVDILMPSHTRRTDSVDDDFGNLTVTKNTTEVETKGESDNTKLQLEGKMAVETENDTKHGVEDTVVQTKVDTPVTTKVDSVGDVKVDTADNTKDESKGNVNVEADNEPPGLRIIGGHAAISSGMPLNNKGRRGYFSDFKFNY